MKIAVSLASILLLTSAAMASDVNTWSEDPDDNTTASPDGFPSNISPSQVHGSVREIMAATRRWQERAGATVTSGGSANAQTLTYTTPPTDCVAGDVNMFVAGYSNTGAMTLGNGACTAAVQLGGVALVGGEVVAGRTIEVVYNGTTWQLVAGVTHSVYATVGWTEAVSPDKMVVFTASTASMITDIRGTVAAPVGATAAISIFKAPSGTACSGGTNLIDSAGTFNANGTAATNQVLTPAGSGAGLLSAGDRVCLSTSDGSNFTGGTGIGGITFTLTMP